MIIGVLLVCAYFGFALVGPSFSPDPLAQSRDILQPPSAAHWFGTDHMGRDLFARIAAGSRVSIQVAGASVLLGLLIALPLGISAGFFGGRWGDELIMRVFETIQAIPLFVLALFVIGMTGQHAVTIGPLTIQPSTKVIILLGIAAMPFFARVARAGTLVEAREDYVASLEMIGVPKRSVILGEMLPNVLPPVIVQGCLWMAVAVFAEGALGFLGLGVPPPSPTLGSTISESGSYLMAGAWWFSVIPGLVLLLATLGFNLLGDGLNELLDARRSS